VPLHHRETPVLQAILHATGGQCRGDPVGRPLGAPHAGCAIWDTHENAILDTHESLRGLKVGCCHRKQPTGKFGPENIHKPRGNARTSPPPAKPRPRISRQGSTTNPAGKDNNCEHATLGAREFLCVSENSAQFKRSQECGYTYSQRLRAPAAWGSGRTRQLKPTPEAVLTHELVRSAQFRSRRVAAVVMSVDLRRMVTAGLGPVHQAFFTTPCSSSSNSYAPFPLSSSGRGHPDGPRAKTSA
jgi:hypothetical protein